MKRKFNLINENTVNITPAKLIANAIEILNFQEAYNLIEQHSSSSIFFEDNTSNSLNDILSGFLAIPIENAIIHSREISQIFNILLLKFNLTNYQHLLAEALTLAFNSNLPLVSNIIPYINDIHILENALFQSLIRLELNTELEPIREQIEAHIDNLRLNQISQNYLSNEFLRNTLTDSTETTKYLFLLAQKISQTKNQNEKNQYTKIIKEIFYNMPEDQQYQVNLNIIEFLEPINSIIYNIYEEPEEELINVGFYFSTISLIETDNSQQNTSFVGENTERVMRTHSSFSDHS